MKIAYIIVMTPKRKLLICLLGNTAPLAVVIATTVVL